MKVMKQTAVQWLEIVLIPDPISEEDFEHNINCWKQAKAMEKEQLKNVWLDGRNSRINGQDPLDQIKNL